MIKLVVLLAWAPPVEVQRPHAGAPELALSWSTGGATGCPGREQLIERIAAQGEGIRDRIGDWIPPRHAEAGLAVEVEVGISGERWHAELTLVDADGRASKSFEAQSCEALADATALIVAVTLDPVAVASALQASATAPASEPKPAPEPPPEPEPKPEQRPPTPASRHAEISDDDERGGELNLSISGDGDDASWPAGLQLGLSLHGGAGWGPTTAFHGAVGGRVALLGRRWRTELGARWSTPRRVDLEAASGAFDAWLIEARGCFVPEAGAVELPLCPGFELGSVRGRGVEPTPNATTRSFSWLAPTLGQGISWAPVDRFALGFELALVVPLTRGRFAVGTTEVERLALVGGRALATVELRLP